MRGFLPAGVVWVSTLAAAVASSPVADVRQRLDATVAGKWQVLQLTPTATTDDATFLRRVWLDLAGRVPPPLQAREFLDNRDPDKRAKLVEALLASEDFADHWGRSWAQALTGQRALKYERYDGRVLHKYLKDSLAANKSYRQLVTELICGEGLNDGSGPANFLLRYEARPTDLAGAVSKQFLGVSLQCAQCHDHPFAPWKKDDFWGLAAFFARLRRLDYAGNEEMLAAVLESRRGELLVPDLQAKPDDQGNTPMKKVMPRFPVDKTAPGSVPRRQALAAWITADNNPYFARSLVNRVWAQLFGSPLVPNLDRTFDETDGKHPRILDVLAQDFTHNGHDLKRLIRIIVLSRAYQLGAGSGATHPETDAEARTRLLKLRNLAQFPVRPLTVDQLFESIVQASGYGGDEAAEEATSSDDVDEAATVDSPVLFLGERALTVQRSLALLNSDYVHKALQAGARTACTVNGTRPGPAHVEWLFLTTLARRPSAEEAAAMLALITDGKKKGLEDVLWVLLNCAEFNTNH